MCKYIQRIRTKCFQISIKFVLAIFMKFYILKYFFKSKLEEFGRINKTNFQLSNGVEQGIYWIFQLLL